MFGDLNYFLSSAARPPRPSRPKIVSVTSTTITVSWEENPCTGGHTIGFFNLRYALPFDFNHFIFPPFFVDYTYIRGINPDVRNYTISNLRPSTSYDISVQAVSVDTTFSSFSLGITVDTLPPGMCLVANNYTHG